MLNKIKLFDKIKEFNEFPESVKKAILLEYISWAWCFLTLYLYLYDPPEYVPYREAISGVAICILILMVKNWVRVLCLLANVMIIIQFSPPFLGDLLNDNVTRGVVLGINLVLFASASYFMFIKTTADFFKANSPKWSFDPKTGKDVRKQ